MTMANPLRGESSLEIEGTVYNLKMSMNAICIAEKLTGLKTPEMLNDLQEGSFTVIRALFAASMSGKIQDMTLEKAGDLMQAAGIDVVTDTLTKMLESAFPKPKTETGAANPL